MGEIWDSIMETLPPLGMENFKLDHWIQWKQKFKIRTFSGPFNELTDRQQISIFMKAIGDDCVSIFAYLNVDLDTLTYNELQEVFTDYFNPYKARWVFLNSKQQHIDSFEQFMERLELLSWACNYGPLRQSFVRDIFTSNLHEMYHEIREPLLKLVDPTMDETLKRANFLWYKSYDSQIQQSMASMSLKSPTDTVANSLIRGESYPKRKSPSAGSMSVNSQSYKKGTKSLSVGNPSDNSFIVHQGDIFNVKVLFVNNNDELHVYPVEWLSHRARLLGDLNDAMQGKVSQSKLKIDNIFAAKVDNEWHRVSIASINSSCVQIRSIDWGWWMSIDDSAIYTLPLEFANVDPKAIAIELREPTFKQFRENDIIQLSFIEQKTDVWIVEFMGFPLKENGNSNVNISNKRGDNSRMRNHCSKNDPLRCQSRPKMANGKNSPNEFADERKNANITRDRLEGHLTKFDTSKENTQNNYRRDNQRLSLHGDQHIGQNNLLSGKNGGERRCDSRQDRRNGNKGNRGRGEGSNRSLANSDDTPRGQSLNGQPNRNSTEPGTRERNSNQQITQGKYDDANKPNKTQDSSFRKANNLRQRGRNDKYDKDNKSADTFGKNSGQHFPKGSQVDDVIKPHQPIPSGCFTQVKIIYISPSSQHAYVTCRLNEMTDLTSTLNENYTSRNLSLEVPLKGAKCAAPFENEWFRAEILSTNETAQTADVFFYDYGNECTVSINELMELPDHLQKLEPLSFCITYPKTMRYVESEDIEIKPIGENYDGVLNVEFKGHGDTAQSPHSMNQSLLLTDNNPKPCRRPESTGVNPPIPMNTFTRVEIVYSGDEGIFVTEPDNLSKLQSYTKELSFNCTLPKYGNPIVGGMCIAPYDGHNYRAKVISVGESTSRVVFIDFGNEDNIDSRELLELPREYMSEPIVFKIRFDPKSKTSQESGSKLDISPITLGPDNEWLVQVKGEPISSEHQLPKVNLDGCRRMNGQAGQRYT